MVENIKDLNDLKTAIQSIIVKDYGDFKRKTVLYLNRYAEAHPPKAGLQPTFDNMINKIQYTPNNDIEYTRAWTIEELKKF